MVVVIPVVVLVVFALVLMYRPQAKEAKRKRVEEFAIDLLARFSDADLVAEVERRREADPEGFARRAASGERTRDDVIKVLQAEFERSRRRGFSSGYAAGSPITR